MDKNQQQDLIDWSKAPEKAVGAVLFRAKQEVSAWVFEGIQRDDSGFYCYTSEDRKQGWFSCRFNSFVKRPGATVQEFR